MFASRFYILLSLVAVVALAELIFAQGVDVDSDDNESQQGIHLMSARAFAGKNVNYRQNTFGFQYPPELRNYTPRGPLGGRIFLPQLDSEDRSTYDSETDKSDNNDSDDDNHGNDKDNDDDDVSMDID